jgi:RNA polymerase sigma-70 factor (ECF subfamily)
MPEQLDEAELLRRLDRAIRTVPRRTREIFLARRLDQLSYAEIAERTGLSVRQVERHMARAINRLCREVDRERLRWWERLLRW